MPRPPSDVADRFLAEGRYAFTVADTAEALGGVSRQAAVENLVRLQKRNEVFSPAKGLYVAIPPEYRSWGVVPADWFVDDLMRHLRRPYYVALLSAARIHGASHQAPQVFQVMTTTARIRDREIGRVRLRFYGSKNVEEDKVERVTVPTGYAVVSAKETTVVDLVSHYRDVGGYGNVATILREIGELNGSEVARVAARRGRAVVRRTGWFVEQFGKTDDLEALKQAARVDVGEPSPLDPSGPRRGKTDRGWRLRVNRTVEPDW